ncbi:MAG: dihydrolipoyl dehydrogenase [Firmicutes bacterium]|nr:dihydrolipoyl dehydrogenase [Bacillota bacterium]
MFDAVVVGGGPGGYVAAIKGAQMGGRIALVEKDRVGGTCLNRGCIPTKALVRTAEVLDLARRGAEFGVQVQGTSLDMMKVTARKDMVVSQLVGGVQLLLKSWGVEVIQGAGRVAGPGRVDVVKADGSTISLDTRTVIIATGSRAVNLPVPGADLQGVLVSEAALDLDHVPPRLAVIGAGVIGIEMACIFRSFGSEVTVLEKLPGILPPVDEEISRRLTALLKRKGIVVQAGVSVEGIGANADGSKRVYGKDQAGNPLQTDCDVAIVSVGRRPDFGGIDLDALGVAYDRKGIKVDEHLMTNVPGIYAVGDVLGRTWLAHVASHEGITAMRNIMGESTSMEYDVIPACVFSSPEIGWVGINEQEARARGLQVKASRFPFSANGRALILGEADGMVKVLADQQGRLVGVHILGPHADDLVHEAAAALKMGATACEMAEMIHSHPTLAEAVGEAFLGVDGSPIHFAKQRR